MDAVSTWTLDALVSAGGETVETTLKVTIEDDPPEPDVGYKDHGMAVGPVLLALNPKALVLLITYGGKECTVGVNERPVVVEIDYTMFRTGRTAAELLIESAELNTEIAAHIAEIQQTLWSITHDSDTHIHRRS